MSQQKKLERVLDLLLSEDSDQASELLHQIIVEKARTIYEGIVDDDEKDELDESDEVGGEPNEDFTDEIAADKDEVEGDHQNDGEAEEAEDDSEEGADNFDADTDAEGDFGAEAEGSTEERVEDLESQLAELRAEFDALMGDEMGQGDELGGDEFGGDELGGDDEVEPAFGAESDPQDGIPDFGGGAEEKVVGEVVATMFEKKKASKLEKAPEKKDLKKDKKVDEETKFLNTVADTGQKGTAKLVGTGKDTPLGAEQNKSPYTSVPARKDYGGKPTKIGSGTGGEYGKYNGDSAQDKTPTDNVNVKPKNSSVKADTTAKFTGGKTAGEGFTKSPLTKKPAGGQ
jgi:hypothetical protein